MNACIICMGVDCDVDATLMFAGLPNLTYFYPKRIPRRLLGVTSVSCHICALSPWDMMLKTMTLEQSREARQV